MADETLATRVYEIRIQGLQDAESSLQRLIDKINQADEAKRKLNVSLSEATTSGDTKTISDLTAAIQKLEAELEDLRNKETALRKEIELLNAAQKQSKTTSDDASRSSKQRQADAEKEVSAFQKLTAQIKQLDDAIKSAEISRKEGLESLVDLPTGETGTLEEGKAILQSMQAEWERLNKIKRDSTGITTEINRAEENSLSLLKQQKDTLEQLIARRRSNTQQPINFQGQDFNLSQARSLLNFINQEIEREEKALGLVNEKQQVQLNRLEQIKADIKEITNLISTAQAGNKDFITIGDTDIPLQNAVEHIQTLKIEQNNLNRLLEVSKNITDQRNISEENSLTKLRQERVELEQIVRNRAEGQVSAFNPFTGSDQSIDRMITRIAEINNLEKIWKDNVKLRQLAIEASGTSLDALDARAKLFTATLLRLNGQLSNQEWLELRSNIAGLIPEIATMSVQQINAGKGTDILTNATFKANEQLREFKRSISGSNTLVGDYTKGIIDAFKQLNLGGILQKEKNDIDIQANQIASRINLLSEQWLAAEAKATGGGAALENELKQLGVQYANLQAKSTNLGQALLQTGGVGTQVTRAIGEGFKGLDSTIKTTLVTYLGFQAALSAVTQVIRIDKQVSDQFADLQRVLGATTTEMNVLIASIRELDTRTSLPDLFNFALIAARAGVATDNIAGVTKAIDRLHVVAGDSIGNIEEVTTNIVKIINVFEGAGHVTEESVTRIGNALISLESSGVATTQFLVNFTDRLAGVEGVTKIGIKSVLGLAAAFEETGATAEVSASAITQILLRINSDIAKYAGLAKGITDPLKVAPQDVEAFRQLVRDNPGKALIDLAVGLRNNKQYLDEFAEGLGSLSARGVRITSVFGLLGANAEHFTQRIQDASDAIDGHGVLIDQAAAKQETFAATLDKIGKELQLAFSNPNVINSLNSIGNAILFFVRILTAIPFGVVITSLSLLAAGWAAYRGQVIATTLAQNLNNQSTILGNVARLAQRLGLLGSTAAQTANNIAVNTGTISVTGFAGATRAATGAVVGMNTALELSPLGIILGVIALAIPLMSSLADSMTKVAVQTDRLKEASQAANVKYNEQLKIFQANQQAAQDLLPKYNRLTEELKNMDKNSADFKTKQAELNDITKQLAEIFPLATKGLNEYGDATDIVTGKVGKLAEAQRAALFDTANAAQEVDQQRLTQLQRNQEALDKLADQALAGTLKVRKQVGTTPSGFRTAPTPIFAEVAATDAENEKALKDAANSRKEIASLTKTLFDREIQINTNFKGVTAASQETDKQVSLTLAQWRAELKKVQDQLKVLDSLSFLLPEQQKKFDELIERERDIKEKIRRLGGETEKVSLSNVRFQKDELAEIEAIRARELAIENTRFANIQEQRKRLLEIEKGYFADVRVVHELTLGEQITHIKNLQAINDQADEQRLEKLRELARNTERLRDAASGTERAKLQSQLIQEQKDIEETTNKIAERRVNTNKEIQSRIDTDFREETRVEKKALESRIAELETTFEALAQTQNIPFVVIAEAQKTLHQQEFLETQRHYNDLITIGRAQGANVDTLQEEENKALQDIIKKGLGDARNIYDSYFKDIEKKFDDQLAHQNERLNQVRNRILDANLPQPQRQALLGATDDIEKINQATNEFNKASALYSTKLGDFFLGRNKVTQAELDELYNNLTLTKRSVQDALDTLNEGINKFGNTREALVSRIGNLFSNVFKIDVGDDAKTVARKKALVQELSTTIESSFATAQQAMNAYFDAERDRIEQSKNAIISRMELEKEQAEAQAQSQAERDSLDREFAARKRDEERKAFEANKKIQVEQAKINFAMELSNLAVVASSPTPANFLTLGVAGRILYGIQAALALIRYLITVGRIQSAQFTGALGMFIEKLSNGNLIAKLSTGKLIAHLDNSTVTAKLAQGSDIPIKGGRIGGEYHEKGGTKFIYNNKIYEAEKEEILTHTSSGVSVIRTRNAPTGRKYRVEGSQEQIASAINVVGGGINFKPGWKIEKLQTGGFLSEGFPSFQFAQAPANPSTFLNRDNDNTELKRMISDLASQVKVVTNRVDTVNEGLAEISDQTNQRIDQIKVVAVAHEVVTKDRNIKKANSIGSL